ncbi:MAG: class I SAM-dependent methyltransferase [Thermodesulfobacteriota bacterium]
MKPNFFDDYYNSKDFYYGREVRPEFSRFLGQLNNPHSYRVLDLGCGDGRYTVYLAEKGFKVHGIDLSPRGLEKLSSYARKHGLPITTEKADLNRKTLPTEKYDLIVFATILEHLNKKGREHLVGEINSSLKPGSYFYGNVFTREDPGYLSQQEKPLLENVSETAGAIRHYFVSGELHNYFASNQILEYHEFQEEDLSHGPPHMHSWACILGRKPLDTDNTRSQSRCSEQ